MTCSASALGAAASRSLTPACSIRRSKLGLLFGYELPTASRSRLAPFLDLVVVWNRGISYGLFQQDSELGRWVLLGLLIAGSVGLSLWIRRAPRPLVARSRSG